MKYLITSSLLDSFEWLKMCPDSWKRKAIDDFISMLKREKRPTSAACQRGIEFENLVCNYNNLSDSDYLNFLKDYYKGLGEEKSQIAVSSTFEIWNICKGGKQQEKLMKDIVVDDNEYHLFGYADIVFPDVIYDIKTTGRFKGENSYLNRSQHRIYSICTGINKFEYLVADFGSTDYPKKIIKVKTETNPTENVEIISNKIREVIKFIDLSGLKKDYIEIFTAKHNDNLSKK